MKNKIFIFCFSFFINTHPNNFLELENYLKNELNLLLNKNNIKKTDGWIDNTFKSNMVVIPHSIIKKILKQPTLFNEFVKDVNKEALIYFINLKKSSTVNNIQHTELDIIEYLLSEGLSIIRYPQREIITNTLSKIRIVEPPLADKIENLINLTQLFYIELRKPLEILNQLKVIDYLKKVNLKTVKDIKITHIININKLLLQNIYNEYAGKWRAVPASIKKYKSKYPNALKVPQLMQEFIEWLHSTSENNIIKLAAQANIKLSMIHPFIDANKRTTIFLTNLILTLHNYPLFIISGSHNKYCDYCRTIDESNILGNPSNLCNFLTNCIEKSKLHKLGLNQCKKIGIYTGTFDPIHLGHDKVIKESLKTQNLDYIFIIPNSYNTSKPFKTDLELRQQLIHNIYCKEKQIIPTFWDKNQIIDYIKNINPNIKIVCIMGSDNAKYCYQNDIFPCNVDEFIIALRYHGHDMQNKKLDNMPTACIPIVDNASSTKIKELLKNKNIDFRKLPLHKETIEFIKKHNLYRAKLLLPHSI